MVATLILAGVLGACFGWHWADLPFRAFAWRTLILSLVGGLLIACTTQALGLGP